MEISIGVAAITTLALSFVSAIIPWVNAEAIVIALPAIAHSPAQPRGTRGCGDSGPDGRQVRGLLRGTSRRAHRTVENGGTAGAMAGACGFVAVKRLRDRGVQLRGRDPAVLRDVGDRRRRRDESGMVSRRGNRWTAHAIQRARARCAVDRVASFGSWALGYRLPA